MGRHLKNTVFKSASHAMGVPVGSTTLGPDSPVDGLMRFNTATNALEYYALGAWVAVANIGSGSATKDSFVGDGTTVSYAMTYAYASGKEPTVMVFVNTVFQNPGIDFTFNGTSGITFTTVPPNNSTIIVLHGYASA